jgi:hypothetical protein
VIPISRSSPEPLIVPVAGVGTVSDGKQAINQNFADLLGGLVKSSTGAAGFLDDQGETQLSNSTVSQEANVFNENGFFYGSVTGATNPSIVPVDSATEISIKNPVVVADVEFQVAASSVPITSESSPTASVLYKSPSSIDAAILRTDSSPLHIGTRSSLGSISFANGNAVIGDYGLSVNTESEPDLVPLRSTGVGRVARLLDATGAKNAIEVSLQAVDHGQAVVVHIGSLESETREKLRDRILALLSRHGLSAHAIRIYGRSGGPSTLEKGS